MLDITYEQVMAILQEEHNIEMQCAIKSKAMMRKTLNPFARRRYKKCYDMFSEHAIGISLAQSAIKRKMGSN